MPLDEKTILRLLAIQRREPTPYEGPVSVLNKSDCCRMCLHKATVIAMYTVDGVPLCSPHAMFALSDICIKNGYDFTVSQKVKEVADAA